MINIYDYLAKRSYTVKKENLPVEEEGLQSFEVEKEKVYRFFDNGEYVLYKNFTHPNNGIKFIDEMDPANRMRKVRKEFNYNGLCHKKIIYKQGTTNKIEEIFYDEHGKAYLNKNYNGTSEEKLVRIYYFNENEILEFTSEKELFKYCFELMIENNSTVICDARLLDRPLIEMKADVKKVFVLHSSHLTGEDINELKPSYKYLINQYDNLDAIVTLTEQQKNDLVQIINDDRKIKVIPHSTPINTSFEINRENKFVYMGRLTPEKQIDHLIEAYNIARRDIGDYTLDIYGDGNEKDNLSQLINRYNLQNKVTLKGRTNNPEKAFSSAKASFITSKYEGFGLVIMESLNNGCPVVAYDMKYGPSDLIEHEKNGLIVERNNVQELARAMVKVTKVNYNVDQLPNKFSDQYFVDSWVNLLSGREKKGFFSSFFK